MNARKAIAACAVALCALLTSPLPASATEAALVPSASGVMALDGSTKPGVEPTDPQPIPPGAERISVWCKIPPLDMLAGCKVMPEVEAIGHAA